MHFEFFQAANYAECPDNLDLSAPSHNNLLLSSPCPSAAGDHVILSHDR